uniref:Uncharacterized protein n=1 Tax=Zea mays TaxID=4577 RepID=C0PMB8_MAIZE|nr:unknown [Zea mays]
MVQCMTIKAFFLGKHSKPMKGLLEKHSNNKAKREQRTPAECSNNFVLLGDAQNVRQGQSYIRTPAVLSSAFFAILNLLAKSFPESSAITCCLMNITMPSLNTSSSGRPATRVKTFHTRASSFCSKVSNSIRKCETLAGVISTGLARLTTFKVARESVKFNSISATSFARFMDLLDSILSSSLKWSQMQYCKLNLWFFSWLHSLEARTV